MAKTYTDYLKEILLSKKDLRDESINAMKESIEVEKDKAKKEFSDKMSEIDDDFTKKINIENVKKYIDQRNLEESLSNLGLTESGYKNVKKKKASIDHQKSVKSIFDDNKKKALKLQGDFKSEIDELDLERLEKENKINEDFDDEAAREAQSLFKAATKTSGASGSKDKNKKDDKKEEEESDELPTLNDIQQYSVDLVLKKLPTRREYVREKKLDSSLPSYDAFIIRYLDSYKRTAQLSQEAYDYIIKYLNIRVPEEE